MLFIEHMRGIFNKVQSYSNSRYRVHERLSGVEDFLSRFPVQFIMGNVVECITNGDSIVSLQQDININAIKATKHINKEIDSDNIDALQSDIYFPLLRGIVDGPTQGDPVLLCEFGGNKYYIGPLNTINSPNFNPDMLLRSDNSEKYRSGKSNNTTDILKSLNVNPHFLPTSGVKRLHKFINEMDYVVDGNASPFNRSVGDLMLEGRYGNSIRVGSRSGRPNIFISNGRNMENRVESLYDGCLITMTSMGTFKNHFSYPDKNISQELELPSNINNETNREINFNNKYNNSQILILSDRLVFASRSDSILISSFNNVEIGSGENLKIYTKNDTIIDSGNIYFGRPYDENSSYEMSPAVLGTELVNMLKDIIDAIGKCNVGMTQPSGYTATIDGETVPTGGNIGSGWYELQKIKNNLNRIQSKYVFIGLNRNWQ